MRDFAPHSLVAVLTLLLLSSTALAQTGNWAAVEGLRTAAVISVNTVKGEKFHGEFEAADPEHLVLWSSERSFPAASQFVESCLARV